MRIKTHPDKLKRNPGLSPEDLAKIDADAARVGWAADILSDTQMVSNSVSFGCRSDTNSIDSAEGMMLNCKLGMGIAREGEEPWSIVNSKDILAG